MGKNYFPRLGRGTGWAAPLFLFLLLAALNSFLVSPYIGWYDSGEMVGTTLCLGISHPSGQVLFHLLGKVFLLFPFGTPAYRLGLLSVFCSALASALFFILSQKLALSLSRDSKTLSPRVSGWLFLLTLAWSLSLPWWRYSLTPLVYALHLFLAMLALWALSLEKPAKWPLVFFILGVATVFRATQMFALPFAGIAFLFEATRQGAGKRSGGFAGKLKILFRSRSFFLTLAAFALGRSTALYLPLRSALQPPIAYADLTRFQDFFHHLLALRFSHYVGRVTASSLASLSGQMLQRYWADLTFLGVGLLAAGLTLLPGNRRNFPVFFWVAAGWGLLETLFVFNIPFPTFESHQVLLGWAFSGFLAVAPILILGRWTEGDRGRRISVFLVFTLFVATQAFSLGHFLKRKAERGSQDYARNVLELMEPGSLYLPTEENEYFPLVGYQQSFGFQKTVEVMEPGTDSARIALKIKKGLGEGRALYVSRKWPLPPGWRFRAEGPLLRVAGDFPENLPEKIKGETRPAGLWGNIGLLGASVSPGKVSAGGRIEIRYRWMRRGPGVGDGTDSIVALFVDDGGNVLLKHGVFWLHDIHEGPLPRLALMKPGYEYPERRILLIPSDFPPGRYHLAVGLQKSAPAPREGREAFSREFYERGGFQNLDKFMGRGENNAIVQFGTAAADSLGADLWPLSPGAGRPLDARFVNAGELEITPADETR